MSSLETNPLQLMHSYRLTMSVLLLVSFKRLWVNMDSSFITITWCLLPRSKISLFASSENTSLQHSYSVQWRYFQNFINLACLWGVVRSGLHIIVWYIMPYFFSLRTDLGWRFRLQFFESWREVRWRFFQAVMLFTSGDLSFYPDFPFNYFTFGPFLLLGPSWIPNRPFCVPHCALHVHSIKRTLEGVDRTYGWVSFSEIITFITYRRVSSGLDDVSP